MGCKSNFKLFYIFDQSFYKMGSSKVQFVLQIQKCHVKEYLLIISLQLAFSRTWVGGEVIQAVAYDVPIPGYKTKNTNSLRLWEAKASSDDFNLFQFNDGQYESAAQLHSRAQQVGLSRAFYKKFMEQSLSLSP